MNETNKAVKLVQTMWLPADCSALVQMRVITEPGGTPMMLELDQSWYIRYPSCE